MRTRKKRNYKKAYIPSALDRRGLRESRPDIEATAVLKHAVPDDTRDLTARTFGDPLPGRRAIDRVKGPS